MKRKTKSKNWTSLPILHCQVLVIARSAQQRIIPGSINNDEIC